MAEDRHYTVTIDDLLEQLRRRSTSKREKGRLFERLIRLFLRTDPLYKQLFDEVWLWDDAPTRTGADAGIDLVARERDTGNLWAIQCKFYDEHHIIRRADIDSFFTASGKHPYVHRMLVVTAPMDRQAQEACSDQQIPVQILDLEALRRSPIDWGQFSWDAPDRLELRPKKTLRKDQEEAVQAVLNGFVTHDRGKLIMACGTGKTLTALKIAERLLPERGTVLVVVPSIALLSQTLREWTAEAERPIRALAVCSDTTVGRDREAEDLRPSELAYPATTNPERLARAFHANPDDVGITVIFSTYQSIDVIGEAQKRHGLPPFNLMICDEAHRTTGVATTGKTSYFTKVHNDEFLQAEKRLYMTATPRIYAAKSKQKAKQEQLEVYSMDDEAIYGPEFYRLNFSKAVEMGILSDYKVLVLAVDRNMLLNSPLRSEIQTTKTELRLDDFAKIIGIWHALAKKRWESVDPAPMRRAVAFASSIRYSKQFAAEFSAAVATFERDAQVALPVVQHIDGTENVVSRNRKLQWLREEQHTDACRILSNARCLTEGVDVPALDAVIFLNPRKSEVDVVQAVGRVMRKAPGKQYGYVILPIVVSSDQAPEEALDHDENYKVVWQVLNALRAHDDRFNILVNQLEVNRKKPDKIHVIGVTTPELDSSDGGEVSRKIDETAERIEEAIQLRISLMEQWRDAIYAKIVQKCGDRRYWEDWAKDVAAIVGRHVEHIRAILKAEDKGTTLAKQAFQAYLDGLHANINDKIHEDEAIEMLAQHMVTKPVFDALFENYEFTAKNPVSRSMERVLDVLADYGLAKETASLQGFYESVRKRIQGIDSAEGKQRVITELYEKFFKLAFPKTAERMGIVYTPIEIVDFILHSVEEILRDEFGVGMADKGVHILDPFTGTGTFLVRLLQSGLIPPEKLAWKYKHELHANEILLLAYYIAAINIEETYHELTGNYEPFNGIVLTDTFQLPESIQIRFDPLFSENNERIERQRRSDIRVIVWNPPYSVGQRRQNDNNPNLRYPALDRRIAETYAKYSTATLKRNLYDSYVRAFRWASDRIGDRGVIGFVTNASFLDSLAMDGVRASLAREFTAIYTVNLRGDAGTSGERRRREGEGVFGEGSRRPIAITLLVKNPAKAGQCVIRYHDIGDYLTRKQKLSKLCEARSIRGLDWVEIRPNRYHDWINQRSEAFEKGMPLEENTDPNQPAVFAIRSLGVSTNRDEWTYNFSQTSVRQHMRRMIDFYNQQVDGFKALGKVRPTLADVDAFIDTDPHKISWSRGLKQELRKGRRHDFGEGRLAVSMYRPFCKQWLYVHRVFIEEMSKMPRLFPDESARNQAIVVTGRGASKDFSALMVDVIPNLDLQDKGQVFPRYHYTSDATGRPIREDAVTDGALRVFRERYGNTVTKDDIFYYVYGALHEPTYRRRFADDLRKSLPRIPLAEKPEDFWTVCHIGKRLASLHVNYEKVDPWPVEEVILDGHPDEEDMYRVTKMEFAKTPDGEKDKTAIVYNEHLVLRGIPLEAYEYVVNGLSAIEWVMEMYQVKRGESSGILNDPNEWSDDPRYVVDLLKRIVRVSMETRELVRQLPVLVREPDEGRDAAEGIA